MARDVARTCGVLTIMMTILMGIGGRLEAALPPFTGRVCLATATAAPPAAQSTRDVVYQLREQTDGSLVVTAASSELTFRKIVFEDGRTEATFERGRDFVTVVSNAAGVTVTRGGTTITLDRENVTEDAISRVRTLWAASPALRAFRALTAALEEDEDDVSPEKLALRLTGVLVAQLDGDDGAVGRMARQLRGKAAGPARKATLAATVDCWAIYVSNTIRAANDLERCYSYYSIWDPRRQACSFVWTLQVEGAWFGYLSCSSVPLK
jgi:hypothetical protein